MGVNENNFVRELKNKNKKALDYLVNNYSNLVFKVIISVLGSDKREDAMECLNDVMLKVWDKIEYHDENKSKFTSWLIAVSKYNAIDYKRKLSKIDLQCDIDELEIAGPGEVEEHILHTENKEIIFTAINELGSPDKEIFIRKYFMGESINEISNSLRITKFAVNSRLFRGRKVLKEKLSFLNREVV